MAQVTRLIINEILQWVINDDWARMLKIFPAGIELDDWVYDSPGDFRFVNEKEKRINGTEQMLPPKWCEMHNLTCRLPRQQLLKAKCLGFVQEKINML